MPLAPKPCVGPRACRRCRPVPSLPPPGTHTTSYYTPPFRLRQNANSLSDENKLLIRCAWAGTSALASAGYGSGWAPSSCPATFTTKAELQTSVREYNANPDAATATYGPIADWDVSAITDMSYLFDGLNNFNTDISGWDTSSVTAMDAMFYVRSARALGPQALSRAFSPCMPLVCRHHTPGLPASRLAPLPPESHALPSTRQRASVFNQPLSFDTSKVTYMRFMFLVRSARALTPKP